jgi:hypothetical protein
MHQHIFFDPIKPFTGQSSEQRFLFYRQNVSRPIQNDIGGAWIVIQYSVGYKVVIDVAVRVEIGSVVARLAAA